MDGVMVDVLRLLQRLQIFRCRTHASGNIHASLPSWHVAISARLAQLCNLLKLSRNIPPPIPLPPQTQPKLPRHPDSISSRAQTTTTLTPTAYFSAQHLSQNNFENHSRIILGTVPLI